MGTALDTETGPPETNAWGSRHSSIEPTWQERWRSSQAFAVPPPDEAKASFVYVDWIAPRGDDGLACVRRFLIADTYARFCRDRGDAVLFAPAIESSGEDVELEAVRRDRSPGDLADRCPEQLRQRYELLGISCDWSRTVLASRPEYRRRTQRIFRELFEAGLVYRRESPPESGSLAEPRWFLRSSAYAESCDRGLDEAPGWTADAIEVQRQALGRVEGIEVDAVLLTGDRLPAFTPYKDAVGDAAFIAISPHHPQLEAVASAAELEQLQNDASAVRMVQTGMQAAIPGVEAPLPIVVAPSVEERFGPTLALGIPNRDDTDHEIAARLETRAGLPFRTSSANSKPRPATRFRLSDRPISRPGSWGIPIPIAHCESCGLVAIDGEEPPETPERQDAQSREPSSCECPECGASAGRDRETIDDNFGYMWAWSTICMPPDDRGSSSLSHPELDRWLPAQQAIWSTSGSERFLDERLAARAAGELGALPALAGAEPFAGAMRSAGVGGGTVEDGCVGDVEELDELVARVGADVVRLTILHAASPRRSARWSPDSIRHSQRFLAELWRYAEPRLSSRELPLPLEIDGSTRMRRRLAVWCRVATDKVSANFERLETHRATYDLMLFLKRIQDFENRCSENGEPTAADRDAVVVALSRLVRLAAPCVPHIAAELEAIARGPVSP
jgi:leucyl-tRNA synthetase